MLKYASVFVASLTLSAAAQAVTVLTANMTNDQEPGSIVPTLSAANGGGPRPVSFGTATFTLNDAQTAMTFEATVFNIDFTGSQSADINDNLTAAHIHAAGAVGTPTFPVVWGFFGTPLNDIAPNDVVVTPFASGVGGTMTGKWDAAEGNNGTTLTAQLPNIFAGRSYVNFHTVQFPGGEVRGVLAIPEPETYALMLAGLGALGVVARRRRR
jgi:hypothetical protein